MATIAFTCGGSQGAGVLELAQKFFNDEVAVVQLRGKAREPCLEARANSELGRGDADASARRPAAPGHSCIPGPRP